MIFHSTEELKDFFELANLLSKFDKKIVLSLLSYSKKELQHIIDIAIQIRNSSY